MDGGGRLVQSHSESPAQRLLPLFPRLNVPQWSACGRAITFCCRTSLTLWIIGCSQSMLTSQWLSRKVRTEAEAELAPRTRERIRPGDGRNETEGRINKNWGGETPKKCPKKEKIRNEASLRLKRPLLVKMLRRLIYFHGNPALS